MPPVRQQVEFKPQCFSRGALALSYVLRFFLRIIFKLTRVKIIGAQNIPRQGALVVVANHVSVLDPVYLFAALPYRPVSFLAMAELWKIPVLGQFVDFIGSIQVKRDSGASRAKSMASAGKVLKHGGLVVVYPQGYVEPQSEITNWYTGCFRTKPKAPVVPVGINGPASVRSGRFWTRVTVKVGRPISPEHFADAHAFASAAKSVVEALSA